MMRAKYKGLNGTFKKILSTLDTQHPWGSPNRVYGEKEFKKVEGQ